MSNWVYEKENEIFTIVSYRAKNNLISQYPNIFFTMDSEPDDTNSHFPTVFVHFLPATEEGKTIDGENINAVNSVVQIEVTVSKEQKQNGARLVCWEMVEQFKKLKYEAKMLPEIKPTGNDTNYCVARMSRVLGSADSL